MAEHRATIVWRRRAEIAAERLVSASKSAEGDFAKGHYSRAHAWRFDGGAEVKASSSPSVVPLPWSDAAGVDPEEAFVASLSACHMLTFIDVARHHGFTVDAYGDEAVGVLGRNAEGRRAIALVTLHPAIAFSGTPPTTDQLAELHHLAHEGCFIANSVRTSVVVAAPADAATGD